VAVTFTLGGASVVLKRGSIARGDGTVLGDRGDLDTLGDLGDRGSSRFAGTGPPPPLLELPLLPVTTSRSPAIEEMGCGTAGHQSASFHPPVAKLRANADAEKAQQPSIIWENKAKRKIRGAGGGWRESLKSIFWI
jgi:hypothetical protein